MRKHLLVTSMLVGVSTALFAQKPTEGDASSLEVQLNLTGDVNTIVAPMLKYRYFISDKMAIRFGLGLQSSTSTDNYTENNDGTGGKGKAEVKIMEWMAAPGFEYHCAGTERLSPYVGLSIGIGGGKRTDKWTNYNGLYFEQSYNVDSEQSYSSFGVGVLAGVDFYFAQNFFVGAEMGLTTQSTTYKEGKATVSDNGTTTSFKVPEAKESSMGISETAAIRLGWRF
ncbi:MAG: outer membrane beta-barrel protein [Flavobacteriales bacterium]|nr:outer membrane beta-barrel protein [Flavobacteriales bacterium]